MHKSFWTSYNGEGKIEGACIYVYIESPQEHSKKPLYRTIIRIDPICFNGVIFPYWWEDKSGEGASAYLPIRTATESFDCFFLKKEGLFIIEGVDGFEDYDSYHGTVNGLKSFLMYFAGLPLGGRSVDQVISEKGEYVNKWFIYPGGGKKSSIYHPIPARWGEWAVAKREYSIPTGKRLLDAEEVSIYWMRYNKNNSLIVPVEYLLFFADAPVEMRGALLSVALESITDILKDELKLKTSGPLHKRMWKKVRVKIIDIFKNSLHKNVQSKVLKLLKSEEPNLSEVGIEIIKKRIESQLNAPTNRDKLTRPFEFYGIEISALESEAIHKRNKFLHEGKLLDFSGSRDNDSWRDVYMIEMALYTAINKLFLSYLGFRGPIINWGEMNLGDDKIKFFNLQPKDIES